jgi:hypothetical protein
LQIYPEVAEDEVQGVEWGCFKRLVNPFEKEIKLHYIMKMGREGHYLQTSVTPWIWSSETSGYFLKLNGHSKNIPQKLKFPNCPGAHSCSQTVALIAGT